MENPILHKVGGILLAVLMSSLFIFIIIGGIVYPYSYQLKHKETAVPVSATISYIYTYTNSDDDEFDKLYLSYVFEGRKYKDIYWDKVRSGYRSVGDTVSVKVDPAEPAHVIKINDDAGGIMFFVVIAVSLLVTMTAYEKSFYKLKKTNDIQTITGNMILRDLSPKRWLTAVRTVLCVTTAHYSMVIFTPDLFNEKIFADCLLIIGVIAFIVILIYVSSLSKKEHILNTKRCVRKWEEGDSEASFYHVRFSGVQKTRHGRKIYDHAEENEIYYTVTNRRGKILEIYDVKKWRMSPEDNMRDECKNVLLTICAETLVCAAATFVFPVIIHFSALLMALI